MMEIESLPWSGPVPGVKAFQIPRGVVNRRNPYSEHNLCDYVGDDALRVIDARLLLCQRLGIDLDRLVMPRQVHGSRVEVIDEAYLQADVDQQEQRLEGVDALVTHLPGICIGVNTADCVPIVLADPHTGIVAVAHAGWRGAVARIAARTVEAMARRGAVPGQILATIGVSICPECFEVGDEVVEAFAQAHHDVDAVTSRHPGTGKAHIDLRMACARTLTEAGVPQGQITITQLCSRCNSDRYFSARRMGVKSGRTFTGIYMQP